MNKGPFARVRERLQPSLDGASTTGTLGEAEVAAACALLEVLADDPEVLRDGCRRYLDSRTSSEPGVLEAYREGLELLAAEGARLHGRRRFDELSLIQRDQVLRGLLRSYPHPLREAPWRRRLRLTGRNLELLFARRRRLRLRRFLVRDLLQHYYTGVRGWSVVGYREFPGHVRAEDEPCAVRGFRIEGDHVVLELSDQTFERLRPETLRWDANGRLVASTKSGRQQARFERSAYDEFCALLEDTGTGVYLRVGDAIHEIADDGPLR